MNLRFIRRLSILARLVAVVLVFSALLGILYTVFMREYTQAEDQLLRLRTEEIEFERKLKLASDSLNAAQLKVAVSRLERTLDTQDINERIELAINNITEAGESTSIGGEISARLGQISDQIIQYQNNAVTLQQVLNAGDEKRETDLFNQMGDSVAQIRADIRSALDEHRTVMQVSYSKLELNKNNRLVALNVTVIGVVVLAFMLSLITSRSITRPLAEIRDAAESFRFGRRNPALPAEDADEVSQIERAINQLFIQLNQGYEDIEKRVVERTRSLSQRAMQLQTAADLARTATGGEELEIVIDRVVNLIRDRFDYYFVCIFLLDSDRRTLVMRAGTGEVGKVLLRRGFRLRIDEASLISYTATTGEIKVVNDIETEFIYRKEILLPLTRSEVVLPMKVGGHLIGVLDIQSTQLNTFNNDHMVVLKILADLLGVTLENNRLTTSLRQAEIEVSTLYRRYTEQSWSPEKLGQAHTGYQFNQIQIEPSEQSLDPEVLDKLREGRPVVVPGENAQSGQSVLLAPVLLYNELIGVIGIEESQEGREWTDDELEVVQVLTSQIVLAIENARLLEETQRRSSQLRLLQEVTAAAAAHTDLNELLDHVAQTLRVGLNLPFVGAVLFDPGMVTGVPVIGVTDSPTSAFKSLQTMIWSLPGNDAVQHIIDRKDALIIRDAQLNTLTRELHPALSRVGTQTLILIPIIYKGTVIGVIDLHVTDAERTFTDDDLQLVNQISLQLSSAIEVARSFEEANLRTERERQVSDVIQRIRQTLDIPTILRIAAQEIRTTLAVPEVTVRLVQNIQEEHPQSNGGDH